MTNSPLTFEEIISQSASWQSALASVDANRTALTALLQEYAGHPLILSGCGSPYYLALSAGVLLRRYAGLAPLVVPASEIILSPHSVLGDGPTPLLIAFSRSGETSEVIAAARTVRDRGGAVLAVGCDASTTLMRMADATVEVAAGRESSVVQTRSFAGMFTAALAITALAAELRGNAAAGVHPAAIPQFGPVLIARARAAVQHGPIGTILRDPGIDRVFVLASGSRYGLACEAALKMQEMSITNAAPYHAMEFRHGPMSLADEQAIVVGLLGEETIDAELAVLGEMRRLGARVIAIGERAPALTIDAGFAFGSGLPAPASDILFMPVLQLMAYERAISKGINPDAPRNLVAFVHLDDLNRSST